MLIFLPTDRFLMLKNKIDSYFDRRAINYEKTEWVLNKDLIQKVQRLFRRFAPGSLLDLGIGTGIIERGLSDLWNVTGIDISPKMLEICQKNLPDTHLLVGDIRKLNTFFKPESFDIIFSRAVLGHMEIKPVITQAKNILTLNGAIILCESIAYIQSDTQVQLDFHNMIHPGHVEFPTVNEFLLKFIESGLSVEYVELIYTRDKISNLYRSIKATKRQQKLLESFLANIPLSSKNHWQIELFGRDITYRRPWLLLIAKKINL